MDPSLSFLHIAASTTIDKCSSNPITSLFNIPQFCLCLICYPDSHHESHVSGSSLAHCLLLLKRLPLLQRAKPVPTSRPLHLLCPLLGPFLPLESHILYRIPPRSETRVFYETFCKLKCYKAKKQLPQDTSCSRMHKIKQDKAQMLTNTVQSNGGLMLKR